MKMLHPYGIVQYQLPGVYRPYFTDLQNYLHDCTSHVDLYLMQDYIDIVTDMSTVSRLDYLGELS